MWTRLSRALLRVFPALLLVVVGLLAALFRSRGGPRGSATTRVAPAFGAPRPRLRRRGAALALLTLLLGIGLTLALREGSGVRDVDGAFKIFASPSSSPGGDAKRPAEARSRTDVDAGRGNTAAPVPSGGSAGQGPSTASGASAPLAPSFDTVRVEPNGDLVVAGRAPPNASVDLLVDGKATARVVADAKGQFAIVPPALPTGNSEIGLRVGDAAGSFRHSRDSVAVAIAPTRDTEPLVAVTSPDKPTVVLSQPGPTQAAPRQMAIRPVPDAPFLRGTATGTGSSAERNSGSVAPGGGASNATAVRDATPPSRDAAAAALDLARPAGIGSGSPGVPQASPSDSAIVGGSEPVSPKVVSVDAQAGGRLSVGGRATVGASVRLYLNDTAIASAKAGRDGVVTFTIGRGVKPGAYKVRLDQVDAASGKVVSRVEVPFSVPDTAPIAETDRSMAAPSEATSNETRGRTAASQVTASSPASGPRRGQAGIGAADAGRAPREPAADPAVVFVPEVRTARIERGDSLWAISRRTYGDGDRYTAIYDANQDQIRDPDLIYPGQVFVLPSEDAVDAEAVGKRG